MTDPHPNNTNNRSSPVKPARAKRDSKCPICKGVAAAASETYPFCSKRCRLVDLGQWFSGDYAISRELEEDDEP